jgi:cysteine synthase B
MGTGTSLRERRPNIRLLAVQPDGPYHALEGVKHMQTTSVVPGIYDAGLPEEVLEISTEEAYGMARCLARQEGLMVGISAAANVAAALRVARTLTEGVVVTILCDSAARYLSDRLWQEDAECEGGAGI